MSAIGYANLRFEVRPADVSEAKPIHSVGEAAAADLTALHGKGQWSEVSPIRAIRSAIADGTQHVVVAGGTIVGAFRISEQKIAFYREEWFHNPNGRALYLRDMAISPDHQRRGTGRLTMGRIESIAIERKVVAIRFDAYEGPAGAGPFYRKCGYTMVHRGRAYEVALEYYEKVMT